jgi:hypothetical protein
MLGTSEQMIRDADIDLDSGLFAACKQCERVRPASSSLELAGDF